MSDEHYHDYERVDLSESTESQVLDLSELAEKHAQNVPFRFQVVNGFMAENSKDPTIGVDEVYTAHLVRELKVVVVNHDGEEFEIPVNSAAKFGLVHESPVSTYNSVDAILSAKNLPKVVAVRSDCTLPNGKVSLKKNEVLIVKKVVKGRFDWIKPALKVFSTVSHEEFVVPKDCNVQFTTDPEATQLYLSDLLNSGIDFMPCSAQIYPGADSSLVALWSRVINIQRQKTHKSVVISLFRDNPSAKRKKENADFIDVPTSINICVSIIKTDKSDEVYERIFKQSEDLLTNFNPSNIQACVDARTNDLYMTQAQLLAEIRRDRVNSEITNSAPQQYQQLLAKHKHESYQPLTPSTKPSANREYETIKPTLPPRPGGGVATGYQATTKELTRSLEESTPPRPGGVPTGYQAITKELTGSLEGTEPNVVIPKKRRVPPPVAVTQDNGRVTEKLEESKPVRMMTHPHMLTSLVLVAPKKGKVPPPVAVAKKNAESLEEIPRKKKPPLPIPVEKIAEVMDEKQSQSTYVKFSKTPQSPSASFLSSKTEFGEIQTTLSAIMKQIGEIQTRQSLFEKELMAMKAQTHAKPSTTITANMSPLEVQMALNAAGLSQYVESFSREAVDGEMFMMLDDEILSNELGVSSRLHRVRITRMMETNT